MSLPPLSDPRWHDIVAGQTEVQFEFLAARILLGRLQMVSPEERTDAVLDKLSGELREALDQNQHLPSVQRDIQKIFG